MSMVVFLSLCTLHGVVCQQLVGSTDWVFIDESRSGRQIPCEVRYPAEENGENTNPSGSSLPTIVFGHGFLMSPSNYSGLAQGLAQAGFVVAMVSTEQTLTPSHEDFGLDLAFVASESQTNSDLGVLQNYLGSSVAIMGHSMGGGASWLAAALNEQIGTVVALAPAETNPSAIAAGADISTPVLVVSGSEDFVTPPATQHLPIYNATSNAPCRAFVSIIGGGHCGFADAGTVCDIGELGFSGISHQQQLEQTLAVLRPWFERWLNGDESGWADFEALTEVPVGLEINWDCGMDFPHLSAMENLLATYPNPSATNMRLKWNGSGDVQVRILDLSGRIWREWTWNGPSHETDLNLPSGLYVISAESEGQIVVRRLVFF